GPHGQPERGPGGELLDVHVAAVLPGRHRAVTTRLIERDPHDAGEGIERHGDTVAHPRAGAVGEIRHLGARLREVLCAEHAAARVPGQGTSSRLWMRWPRA